MHIDVPQLVREQKLDRTRDRQQSAQLLYTPPLDGSLDPHREFDLWIASNVYRILAEAYPGYPWGAKCNAQQGIVYFNIPTLMGDTLHWLIKLGQWHDMSKKLVVDGGGKLLEMMNLPREGFEAQSFERAIRNKHRFQFEDAGKKRFA